MGIAFLNFSALRFQKSSSSSTDTDVDVYEAGITDNVAPFPGVDGPLSDFDQEKQAIRAMLSAHLASGFIPDVEVTDQTFDEADLYKTAKPASLWSRMGDRLSGLFHGFAQAQREMNMGEIRQEMPLSGLFRPRNHP